MGVLLEARCSACRYTRGDLRLGATHAQIAAHDVTTYELFPAPCCGEVQSALVSMGATWQPVPCDRCQVPVVLDRATRYRIATLKGEVYEGHPCPRCGEPKLAFAPGESFL